jgi:hypothetical protein
MPRQHFGAGRERAAAWPDGLHITGTQRKLTKGEACSGLSNTGLFEQRVCSKGDVREALAASWYGGLQTVHANCWLQFRTSKTAASPSLAVLWQSYVSFS